MDPFARVLESNKETFAQICSDHGVILDASKLLQQWTKSNGEVDYPFIGHFFQEEPIVQHALKKLDVEQDAAAILALELLRAYRIGLQAAIRLDNRAVEVRETLNILRARGKRLGVFSNDRAVALNMVLRLMKIDSLFEYVETSESLGIEKPNPKVFQHILAHFGLVPNMVAYVGDDPIEDIDAAKGQGMRAILYQVDNRVYQEKWRDYTRKPENEPDAVVHGFANLLDCII